jgi:hypothetical protein
MNKPRKKFKTAAGKSVKRPKPVKRQFIARAEARRRAERHVLKRTFKGATVQNGAELRLGIYNRGDWTNKDVWVSISFGIAIASLATAFFISDRFHTSAPEMIQGIHKAFIVLGGLTILSTFVFRELKTDDGNNVSQHNTAPHMG